MAHLGTILQSKYLSASQHGMGFRQFRQRKKKNNDEKKKKGTVLEFASYRMERSKTFLHLPTDQSTKAARYRS